MRAHRATSGRTPARHGKVHLAIGRLPHLGPAELAITMVTAALPWVVPTGQAAGWVLRSLAVVGGGSTGAEEPAHAGRVNHHYRSSSSSMVAAWLLPGQAMWQVVCSICQRWGWAMIQLLLWQPGQKGPIGAQLPSGYCVLATAPILRSGPHLPKKGLAAAPLPLLWPR